VVHHLIERSNRKGNEMDFLLALTIIVVGLMALGALAATAGTDSRDPIGDDWARPTRA
jgi:hypothetical protein